MEIDTTKAELGMFKTVPKILLKDVDLLLESKKIHPATIRKAVDYMSVGENEVFYTGGEISKEWIISLREWVIKEAIEMGDSKRTMSRDGMQ